MYNLDTIGAQFGERIRILRQQQNLSQMDLAELADLNTTYIGHLEHGTKSPTLQTLGKLSNALHLSLPELLSLENEPEEADTKTEMQQLLQEYTLRILALTKHSTNDPE